MKAKAKGWILKEEMLAVKTEFGDERRTEIIPVDSDFSMEDMIAEEEVVLTITIGIYKTNSPKHLQNPKAWRSGSSGRNE